MISSLASEFSLEGKVAVVSGGALGIGSAIVARLAQAGATIALLDVDPQEAHATLERVRANGGRGHVFACDVAKLSSISHAIDGVMREFGRIDVLVNNAGIFPFSPALDLSEASWDKVIDVNLKGAFFLTQRCAAQMVTQGSGGSIVNIASVDGMHPTGNLAHYDASKGGLVMLTRSLALELAKNRIRVNTICPGAINTPGVAAAVGGSSALEAAQKQWSARIPMGRLGNPDEIAKAVLFFATDASSYATGSSLVVDGGMLLA